MKNTTLTAFLLSVCLVLFSCKGTKESAANAQSQEPKLKVDSPTDAKLVFTYECTACFGTCPVYEIKVYDNGYATYEGKYYTEFIGLHSATISKDAIDRILSLATEIGFGSYKSEYKSDISDLPSRITGVVINGKLKKVIDRGGDEAPTELRDLEGLIESMTKDISWKAK